MAEELNRLGRGYSFEMIRAKMLFSPSQRREVVSTPKGDPVVTAGRTCADPRRDLERYLAERESTEKSG